MSRAAMIALSVALFIGVAIVVGALIPRGSNPSSLRLDGPYLHAAAFGLLVLPLACAWPRQWRKIVLTAIVFGGVIEGLQISLTGLQSGLTSVRTPLGRLVGVFWDLPSQAYPPVANTQNPLRRGLSPKDPMPRSPGAKL